ncbi:MAG: hypothetical protein J0H96_03095 [Microbacterium ginsengisoli]|nr:hypothetical protein [Microbacterium ginsengisoli]
MATIHTSNAAPIAPSTTKAGPRPALADAAAVTAAMPSSTQKRLRRSAVTTAATATPAAGHHHAVAAGPLCMPAKTAPRTPESSTRPITVIRRAAKGSLRMISARLGRVMG